MVIKMYNPTSQPKHKVLERNSLMELTEQTKLRAKHILYVYRGFYSMIKTNKTN